MALTGMAAKDWRLALDFSTRKVKTLIWRRCWINMMLRKEDLKEWKR